MMKCLRCNEIELPSMVSFIDVLNTHNFYCNKCWAIIQFESAKFTKRPYKIPINRIGV